MQDVVIPWVLALALAACSSSPAPDPPAAGDAAGETVKAAAPDAGAGRLGRAARVRRLGILPMTDEAREAGIRPLDHTPAPAGALPEAKKQRSLVDPIVLTAGTKKPPGLGASKAEGCALSTPFAARLAGGEVEGAVAAIRSSLGAAGRPFADELDGAAVRVFGCDESGERVSRLVAFGEAGAATVERFERSGLPAALAPAQPPHDLPPDLAPRTTAADPIVAGTVDIEGDGAFEVFALAHVRWLDAAGDQVAESGALGVAWADGRPPAVAHFGLDQGLVFPAFEIVPPLLNGGMTLLVSASHCCGGTSVRALDLEDGALEPRDPVLADGDGRVLLQTSNGRRAAIRVLAPLPGGSSVSR